MKSTGPQALSCLSDFELNEKRPVTKNDTWAWSVPVCHIGFGHAWNQCSDSASHGFCNAPNVPAG